MFALVRGSRDELEAVTTLGGDDLHLTGEVVDALNCFLADRDETALDVALARLPKPVRMAAHHYLRTKCTPMLGAFTEVGPVEVVRTAVYFSEIDDELEEYLESAYTIGLGIRMSNERGSDGRVDWVVQVLSDEVFVAASAEPRTWALPDGAKLLHTWTSRQLASGVGPVRSALNEALNASGQGRWVRVHTLLHSYSDVDLVGSGASEFTVDVFDASVPARRTHR
ncbi:hypothetical protein ACWGDX_00955 [Streptomyces sp. NPDC055025]